jgi:hypothetical protein
MGRFEEVLAQVSVMCLEDPSCPPHLRGIYKGRIDEYHIPVKDKEIPHLTAEERACLVRCIYVGSKADYAGFRGGRGGGK